MKGYRNMVLLAAAGLVASLAAPVGAAPTGGIMHETYSSTGSAARGDWSTQDDVAVGMPRVLYVSGADATRTYRTKGSKPVTEAEPALFAYGTTMKDPDTDQLYPAEVWAIPAEADFWLADDLSAATLEFEAEGIVVLYDEATGQEAPTDQTVPLSVSARWTGAGPLTTSKTHSKYTDGQFVTIDRSKATTRQAVVELTVVRGDGVTLFDGVLEYGEMSEGTFSTTLHFAQQ